MLSGHAPFEHPDVHEVLRLHREAPPPPLSAAGPGKRGARPLRRTDPVEPLVRRLLSKDPSQRFPSMNAVATELERARRRVEAEAQLRRWLPLGSGALVVLVAGAILLARLGRTPLPPPPPPSEAAPASDEIEALRGEARRVLLSALQAPQPGPRLAAVRALERARDERSSPQLAALLQPSPSVPPELELAAAHALLRLGHEAGRRRLRELAAADDPALRLRAATLLCEHASPEQQRLLLTTAVQRGAEDVQALEQLGCLVHTPQAAAALRELRARFASLPSGEARLRAGAQLARLGDVAARDWLRAVGKEQQPEAPMALAALAAPDEPELAERGRTILRSGRGGPALQRAAAEALAQSGQLTDLPLLAYRLRTSEGTEQVEAAGGVLRLAADEPAVLAGRSLRWARSELAAAEGARRAAAVGVLAALPDTAPLLGRALTDRDPQVRAAAARALGRSGDASAWAKLEWQLNDPDRAVRGAVLDAMEALTAQLSRDALAAARERMHSLLLAVARRGALAERVSASQLLAALGMPASEVRVLLPDAEPAVRLLLLQRPRADAALVERSLSDGSLEVRFAAARLLAQRGDTRARPVLGAALQQHHEVAQAAALLTALGAPHLEELLHELEPPSAEPEPQIAAARRAAVARASLLLPVASRAAVLARLARDIEPAVRGALLDAIAAEDERAPAAPTLQALRVLSADRQPHVRARAAALLARALHSGVRADLDEDAAHAAGPLASPPAGPVPAGAQATERSETARRASAAPLPPPLARALQAAHAAAEHGPLRRALQQIQRARLLCARKLKREPACARLAPQLELELARLYERHARWPEAMHAYQSVLRSGAPPSAPLAEEAAAAQQAIARLAPRLAHLVVITRIKGTCRQDARWLLPGAVKRTDLPAGRARVLTLKAGDVVHIGSCS